MFSFAVKHLSDTVGTGFTASRAVGDSGLSGAGMKPVMKHYDIRTLYTVDEENGSNPYTVDAMFPSGTYSALDYTPVKSGYRFAGWSDGTSLPYDAEVEYLESTGTQYIDTGIKPVASSFGFSGVFSLTQSTVSNTGGIAGCRTNQNSTAGDTYAMAYYSGSQLRMDIASKYSFLALNTEGINTVSYTQSTSTLNGSSLANSTKTNCSYSFLLFAMNNSSSGINYGKVRIHSWIITANGTVVRHFVPVRVGQTGRMYDRVSGQLFETKGSGSFRFGSDVSNPAGNLSESEPIRYDLHSVTAVWQSPVTVTFDASTNGGEMPSGWTAPYYYGGQKYGTLPTPTKSGSVFVGWFQGGRRILTSTEALYTPHTLTAHYTVPTYDTSFEVTTTSYRKAGIYAANSRNTANPTIVDWGDGSTSVVYGNISQLVHTYSSNGTFTVRVNNNISSFALSANNSTWYDTTSQNRRTIKRVLSLSSNITSLPTYAFYYLSAMTDVVLPTGITSIPNYCLSYCTSINGITIPSNYTSIGQYAFQYSNSSSFTSVTIPASITSIGNYAFSDCQRLHNIVFESSSSTLTLGSYAFQRCFRYSIGTLDLSPRKITAIPAQCFYGCTYVNNIIWPQGLTAIGGYAFCNCFDAATSTGTVSIPEGVTSTTGNYSFGYCRYLTAVTLPSTLTSIGNYCFAVCTRLAAITCGRSTAPTVSAASFGNGTGNYTGRNSYSAGTNKLYVPAGATGYTSSYWGSVLLDSTKCGFSIAYISSGYALGTTDFNTTTAGRASFSMTAYFANGTTASYDSSSLTSGLSGVQRIVASVSSGFGIRVYSSSWTLLTSGSSIDYTLGQDIELDVFAGGEPE